MLSEKEVAMMVESVGAAKTMKYLCGIILGQDIAYKATVGTYLKTLVQMGALDRGVFEKHLSMQEPIYKSCVNTGFEIVGMPITDENAPTSIIINNSWKDMKTFWAKTTFMDNLDNDNKDSDLDEYKSSDIPCDTMNIEEKL